MLRGQVPRAGSPSSSRSLTLRLSLTPFSTRAHYRRVNNQYAEITGWPAADHIGRSIHDVIGKAAKTIEPLLRQVIETVEPLLDVEVTGPLVECGPVTSLPSITIQTERLWSGCVDK